MFIHLLKLGLMDFVTGFPPCFVNRWCYSGRYKFVMREQMCST